MKGNLGYFSPSAVIYQLNLRGPIPRQSPRHLTFSKKIGQMPHHVGSLRGQMPHPPDKEVLKELVKGNFTFHTLISRTKNNTKNIQQRHFSGFIAITLYQLMITLGKMLKQACKSRGPFTCMYFINI